MTSASARLIFCERTGRWAVALRRELADAGVRVWETRSLEQCWEVLAAAPASFVVAELSTANAARLLRRMARLNRDFPAARIALVADRKLADHQWLLREAGAVHFSCSTRRIGAVAQLACRHLAAVPPTPQSLAEQIWKALPWASAADETNSNTLEPRNAQHP